VSDWTEGSLPETICGLFFSSLAGLARGLKNNGLDRAVWTWTRSGLALEALGEADGLDRGILSWTMCGLAQAAGLDLTVLAWTGSGLGATELADRQLVGECTSSLCT
jgi:hypothetical protein